MKSIGLLGGDSGQIILDYYYDKPQDELLNDFKKLFAQYTSTSIGLSFCNGISGTNWLINFFIKKRILDINPDLFLSETDELIYKWMIAQLLNMNIDFLHGSLGAGVYFLSRLHNPKHKKYINDLVDGLESLAIIRDNVVKFKSVIKFGNERTNVYNLSLSHGISSMIYLLSKVYKEGINKKKVYFLLEGCINFLIECMFSSSIRHNSIFPSWKSDESESISSRLAWCYGDLGIGVALYQAGVNSNRKDWERLALEILYECSTRKDLRENGVIDACLCHGTAGIGQCFYRMFLNTKDMIFYNTAHYWFEKTKQMGADNSIRGGLYTWKGRDFGWVKNYSLLEGLTGVGLALYCWEKQIDPIWDQCLLLS